jgi:hypothetical protein
MYGRFPKTMPRPAKSWGVPPSERMATSQRSCGTKYEVCGPITAMGCPLVVSLAVTAMKFERPSGISNPAARRPSRAPRKGSRAPWIGTPVVMTVAAGVGGPDRSAESVLRLPGSHRATPSCSMRGHVSSSLAGDW